MEGHDMSDSEGMSVVADSESDDDENLYTNRIMFIDSLESSPEVSLSCIDLSPAIELLSYRRLTKVKKIAHIPENVLPNQINTKGSTSVSSSMSEDVLSCGGNEGSSNETRKRVGMNSEESDKDAKERAIEKPRSEEMHLQAEQKPVNLCAECTAAQAIQSQSQESHPQGSGVEGGARSSSAVDRSRSCLAVREPSLSSSTTPHPRRHLRPRKAPAASLPPPDPRGWASPSYPRRAALHSSREGRGRGREGTAQPRVTGSARCPVGAEQPSRVVPRPSARSRRLASDARKNENENGSGTLGRRPGCSWVSFAGRQTLNSLRLSAGEQGLKPEPETVLDTKLTVQTRSGSAEAESAVAVGSSQQHKVSCQPSPQPTGCSKAAEEPAHTSRACTRSEMSGLVRCPSAFGGNDVSREMAPEPGHNGRNSLSGKAEGDAPRFERCHSQERKSQPDTEVSVSACCFVNHNKGKHSSSSAAQAKSHGRSRTSDSKTTTLKSKRGKMLHLSSVNRRNVLGETLLHRAVMNGDAGLVRDMLQLGADVNRADYAGWTPLHEAAIGGWCEIAVALLEAGAVVNSIGAKGDTPLHDAIGNGNQQVAQLLLNSGANPSLKNEQGQTALEVTDDDSLRKVMERYLPRAEKKSFSAQSRSNRAYGGNMQQVRHVTQKKDAAKSSRTSVEAVRRARSLNKVGETDAEPRVRVEPGSPVTAPRRRSVMRRQPSKTSPQGQSALPESCSQGRTEGVRLHSQCGAKPVQGQFDMSSVDGVTDVETQEGPQMSGGKATSTAGAKSMRKSNGSERTGETHHIGLTETASESALPSRNAERPDGFHTEQDSQSTESEPLKSLQSEDLKNTTTCHCSHQDYQMNAESNSYNSYSSFLVRSECLNCGSGDQTLESNVISSPALKMFDETGAQCSVPNTQEEQDDSQNTQSPDLACHKGAKNNTGMSEPQAVECETIPKDSTISQHMPGLSVDDEPISEGTTFVLLPGINVDPIINDSTSDLLQNIHSGDFTVGTEAPVTLTPKETELLGDADFSANSREVEMTRESGIGHRSPAGGALEENAEECSISLLAPHSDVLRRIPSRQCLSTENESREQTQPGASKEEQTATAESDRSTPSLLLGDLHRSEGFLPSAQKAYDNRMDVVSDVSGNCDHSTVSECSKFIEPNSTTLPSTLSMRQVSSDSDEKAGSHMLNVVEVEHHLHRLKSRTINENVQMTGVDRQEQEFTVLSHNSESENQRKSAQSHVVVKGLHAAEQVSDLPETNGNKPFTLSCQEGDRIRGRFPEEGYALLTDSPNASVNSIQLTEIEEQSTYEVLKVAPERPGLKCGEELLKKTLVLYNSGSNTFSGSESHVTLTSQETEKASVTEHHMLRTEAQNGEETLVPESSKSNSLRTNNCKDMVLTCKAGGDGEPDMNEATVEEDVTRTKDGKSNSSYDSDCTMISEFDCMEGNTFGAAVESANLHSALTLGSTASQFKGSGKRSFESAFGKSVMNNAENCEGSFTSSIVGSSTSRSAAVDSSPETSKMRNDDFKHKSKAKTKTNKTGKKKCVALSKKQSTRSQATCASACTSATSCQAPMKRLKVPTRNIHKRNSQGESKLHLASKRGDLALIKSLIEAGINVNQRDYAGWTALHEASAKGYTSVAEELLLAGADVRSRGLEGITPLHDAVTSNHYETVKLLLQHGSNPNDKNVFGKSALDLECNEPIKELLSTFSGRSVCESSSEPTIERQTEVRRKPAVPCLCFERDCSLSGIQPTKRIRGGNKFESINATLGNMEKKLNKMSTWELTGPEDTGRFTEAFSLIWTVLNDVLIKHKAENLELIRQYRIASDSFKQSIVREQLTSLASRQKRLLNILQKESVLKHKVQTQRSRLPELQSSTQCTLAGENKSETGNLCRTNTGPCRTTEQEATLSCHSAVPEEMFSSQSISNLGDANVLHDSSDSTHITSDTESVEPETEADAVRDTEVGMPCENIADNVPHMECVMPETVVCSAPHEIPTGLAETKISGDRWLLSEQATGSGNDKQRSEVKGTNVLDSCKPQKDILIVGSNTPCIAISTFTDNHQITQMPQTRPAVLPPSAVYTFPSFLPLYQLIIPCQPQGSIMTNPVALNSHETLASFRTRDNPSRVSSLKLQVSAKVQSNVSETCSKTGMDRAVRCVPDMTSGTAVGVDNQRTVPEAAASTALPQHRDSVDDNRQLIRLIQCGVIKPGDNVLLLTLKGSTYRASLQPDGSIKDTKGQLFLSPEQWIASFLGPSIPVSSTYAWETVMYRSQSLSRYLVSSDQAAKDSVASQQAFVPSVTPAETPCKGKIAKASISNFMKINKVLLISDDDFMPSCLMDHYWDFFSQSEDWAV